MIKYIKQQRDYTVLGITAVIDAMVGHITRDVYGGGFDEILSVVKDGVYYHYEREGGREEASSHIIRSYAEGKIDPEQMYLDFDSQVADWEAFLDLDAGSYSLDTFKKFCHFYQTLFPPAYVGMDAIDLVNTLSEHKRGPFAEFATRMRRRGEIVYKNGETVFIPRYTEWLAQEIFRGYMADELRYLMWDELLGYIDGGTSIPSPLKLQERKQTLYIRQYDTKKYDFAQGKDAEKIIERDGLLLQPESVLSKLTELKGMAAFPGIVRGQARLVRSRREMDKFQDGEILVSQMTDPHFLPIMKRASAFVTNEGGMLCHAAIVARELKKPCVIGTRYATHFLKDGDMVEVDANRGVVRKV